MWKRSEDKNFNKNNKRPKEKEDNVKEEDYKKEENRPN